MPAVNAPLLTAIWLNLVVVEWLADRLAMGFTNGWYRLPQPHLKPLGTPSERG